MSKLALKDRSWSSCAANRNSNTQLHSVPGIKPPSFSQSLASLQSLTAWKVTLSKAPGGKSGNPLIPGSWTNWNPDWKSFLAKQLRMGGCVEQCIVVNITTSHLPKVPQQFQLGVMSSSTYSSQRLWSSFFVREMQLLGESSKSCTELQVLAWVQERVSPY